MTTFKMRLAACAMIAACATPAHSEGGDAGQVSWSSGVSSFSEALCGFSGDDFVMSARSQGVRLRLGFKGEGTLDSVNFADISSVDLSFRDEHVLSGHRYARYSLMGEMGEIDANPENATGALTLRPGSAEALDARPDGLQISYAVECTGEIF
ncbi:hypothetical protein [Roseinatronobacter sp.]